MLIGSEIVDISIEVQVTFILLTDQNCWYIWCYLKSSLFNDKYMQTVITAQ